MLIPLRDLSERYGLAPSGVLHVGAHEGQEADTYDELGYHPIFWVEADGEVVRVLEENVGRRPGHHVVDALCADEERTVTFYRANNGQSSSILEFGTHAREHPKVVYVGHEPREATTVDALLSAGRIGRCGFMNLDVQGAELMVLRGAVRFLDSVDSIYTEVNKRELYKGCALIPELDAYLKALGFKRVETRWTRHGWGDALYVRY
jgi:FkbM family methyltransferase